MNQDIFIKGNLVALRNKLVEDAELDYSWRVDPELAALDATTPLRMTYADFLRIAEDEIRYPVPWSKRFAIETLEGTMIGNCMYYDIDYARGQAEMGILIGDREYWNLGYGSDAVETLVTHIFTDTTLNRIYLHTLSWNIRAQKSFKKCGFIELGPVTKSGYDFIMMELVKESWQADPKRLASG